MAKTYVLSLLVDQAIGRNGEIHYLDCDLQYSSMICQMKGTHEISNSLISGLQLFIPSELEVTRSILELLSLVPRKKAGLVILDSLNSLQNLLREQDYTIDWMKANHEAAVVLTLLQEFSEQYGRILIISNMARAKPKPKEGSVAWEKDISGGRMIRLKSDVVLSVSTEKLRDQGKLLCRVDSSNLAGDNGLSKGQTFELSCDLIWS